MSDLRDRLGDDVPPDELDELARVDALLRRVPAPPAEVPRSLTQAVEAITLERRRWTAARRAAVAAVAAALAAGLVAAGRWSADGGESYRATVPLAATEDARGASGVLKLGERDDATGNWRVTVEVSGLPPLPPGRYYVLWLARDGEYAATCGTFNVGASRTTVELTASYRLADYDAWVISEPGADAPWLLRAAVRA